MLYNFICNILKVLLKPRIRYEGIDNIPSTGALVVVANHVHALDPVVVGVVMSRPTHFLAKKELFAGRFGRWFLMKLLCIPVDRDSIDRTALRRGMEVLKNGDVLGVFPEGTRSVNGEMLPFKSGGSFIASQVPCMFLPVAVTGTERLLHFFQRPVYVKIGKPFPYAALAEEKRRDTLERMTKMQEETVKALLREPEKQS
jgi:1-acyl-sn-glycerol-3-phosphate acyltransferase